MCVLCISSIVMFDNLTFKLKYQPPFFSSVKKPVFSKCNVLMKYNPVKIQILILYIWSGALDYAFFTSCWSISLFIWNRISKRNLGYHSTVFIAFKNHSENMLGNRFTPRNMCFLTSWRYDF